MSRNNEALLEEARLLLPWYLTGQLSTAEQELVENALGQYPNLQDELRHEEQIKKLVCQDAQLLELSALDTTPQRLDNLLRLIEREEEQKESLSNAANVHLARPVAAPAKPKASQPSRWKAWLQDLLDAEWLTPANAVLAGLLICQVGVGLAYVSYTASPKPGEGIYVPASFCEMENVSIKLAPNEQLAFAQFNESATVGEVTRFLEKNKMSLLHDSPANVPNMFVLRFQTNLTDYEQIANYLTQTQHNSAKVISILARTTPEEVCDKQPL
ncbi:hypothetical protein [Thiofilum flexile]|uniref:hypothetical protein n=1 Tax=Thiofilum flexile TaxID=125627 RepID=UPI00036EC004|nr:hypothetical protein [Thiofilum flexile]